MLRDTQCRQLLVGAKNHRGQRRGQQLGSAGAEDELFQQNASVFSTWADTGA
jgi:hypothetical protein